MDMTDNKQKPLLWFGVDRRYQEGLVEGLGSMHAHSIGCGCEPNNGDGEKYSLYRQLNVAGIRGYGEHEVGSAIRPFKPQSQSMDRTMYVECDVDDEEDVDDELPLVLFVPFVGSVRLRQVVVVAVEQQRGGGGGGGGRGVTLELRKNVDKDFSGVPCTQSFPLVPNEDGTVEIAVSAPKFNDCRSIAFCFTAPVRVYYIGMYGDWIKPVQAPLNIVYESAPQMKDHKSRADHAPQAHLGGGF